MTPLFFATQLEFRKWLMKNHQKETELVVGFYKVNSGKPSMTWSQSVDQALCFGWIDSVRKSIDNDSYCIRFTPRRLTSIWSDINIAKVNTLIEQGLMQPSGLEKFEKRRIAKTKIYSYENTVVMLSPAFEKEFKANVQAWTYFNTRTLSYRKTLINWVMSAKQESTRYKRLNQLILESATGAAKIKDTKN